jgi:O-methyltransferase involved in polyketide biosynthesis
MTPCVEPCAMLPPPARLLHLLLRSIPTLWVSECCLIYLDPAEAAALLSWVAAASTGPAAIAIYEQTRPHDAFGRTMLANLVVSSTTYVSWQKGVVTASRVPP